MINAREVTPELKAVVAEKIGLPGNECEMLIDVCAEIAKLSFNYMIEEVERSPLIPQRLKALALLSVIASINGVKADITKDMETMARSCKCD